MINSGRIQTASHIDLKKKLKPITEQEGKDAFRKFLKQQTFYADDIFSRIKWLKFETSSVFKYSLQTYAESRSTAYVYRPSESKTIKSNQHADESNLKPKSLFINETVNQEIPNTATIKDCISCDGSCSQFCYKCNCRGKVVCIHCRGDMRKNCSFCQKQRFLKCKACEGKGKVTCSSCNGYGSIKRFNQLTINYINCKDNYLIKSHDLPGYLAYDCESQALISEQAPKLKAIKTDLEFDIQNVSLKLLNYHSNKFSKNHVIAQRHDLSYIPISTFTYKWSKKIYKFHVYGMDKKIYAKSYPTAMWCCNIS